ncbi:DUF447 family protein [Saccharolobus solfataricus]|uniref:DUF447 family protein n=3 Tax=Saccharolobus solfataricus TaxID=2287 RepID=Q7LXL8_SACS2|nr:DUF447 domain-containing protein [Saccharolobus solfataricus]AAK41022.1 Hypothetical protein SSO0724 [Saccharolobus solfataricus P2]AKA74049.1 DUF447 family protein [Saccharolobus solfataricus]AKA76746.1 DUF447 family protein [Saccharolobus solfataricus]AKA79440.1 DUF447 family protein [Saccharolobus solfataricus]AZF68528.1 DUF447 family protein [Saccharolobus solfataricus]
MKKFLKMFFPHDGIYEVLVGTSGIKPIIKPLGIIVEANELRSKIYKSTLTYSNLEKNNKCSIHVTLDTTFFILSMLDKLTFSIDSDYNVPVLKNLNVIYAECMKTSSTDPSIFTINPLDLEINSNLTRAYNRGDYISVDFLVNYTRLDIYKGEDLEKLVRILEYEWSVIKRTSQYTSSLLEEILNKMRSKGFKLD